METGLTSRYCVAMADFHDRDKMAKALDLARQAAQQGEVPVGAVIYHQPTGKMIAAAHNLTESCADSTAHAEMIAIRQAQKALGTKSLHECDLWVTLEPCAMCAGAIAHARINRLYFGANDPKGGAVENGPHLFSQKTIHHRPEIYGGLSDKEAAALLVDFFSEKRDKN